MSERTAPPIAWAELTLDQRHIDELIASSIKPEVALARGYRTVTKASEVSRLGFGPSQCLVPGILMPTFNIAGKPDGYQLKPDLPRMGADGRIIKYESPRKSTAAADIPQTARHWVVDPSQTLFFTEGIKKADSGASHENAMVALTGVWNWRAPEVLATLDQIPLKGRTVYLAFDSDWRRKRAVAQALKRFAAVLRSRGAVVYAIDFPEPIPGQKVGLDDFYASGGSTIGMLRHAFEIESDADADAAAADAERTGPRPVHGAVPTAPCSAGATIPQGWDVSDVGIHSQKMADAEAFILPTPAIVTDRLVDRTTGDESVRIAYLDHGRWKSLTAYRDVVATASKITTLAKLGFPVTSNTAAEVVRWFSDYMAVNASGLPVVVTSAALGWQGSAGFLLPGRLIVADGGDPSAVTFAAADSGSQDHASALTKVGTLDGWKKAMEPLADYERVRFAVCASLAAPLLEILNTPGFVIDLAGPTSGGKTSALICAGSVWGQSDPSQPCSIVSTFQSTRVYRERISALFNSVPVIVDDTMQARNAAEVQSFLYDVVGGQGRGRGSITGLQSTANWRTVAIISGENSATGMTEAGGTKARTLTCYGRPFGAAEDAHVVIGDVRAGIADHHGHAGEAFVSWLLSQKPEWVRWTSLYRERALEIAERAGGGPVINRVASYLALIEIASVLAELAGVLPWGHQEISATLLHELAGEARGADVAADALIQTLSWAGGRADSFYTAKELFERPPGGWLGRWERDDGSWEVIAFTSDHLRKALEANGHKEFDGIVRQWHERGWLDAGASDDRARRMKQIRIGDGLRLWCYVIKHSAEQEARAALNGAGHGL
ncbi:MAG: DUF927 domain-containing protein [Thermomicrobiales bacterium]